MLCLKLVGSVFIPESGSGAKQSSEGKRGQKKRQSERQSGVSETSYFLDSCTMSTSPGLFPAPKDGSWGQSRTNFDWQWFCAIYVWVYLTTWLLKIPQVGSPHIWLVMVLRPVVLTALNAFYTDILGILLRNSGCLVSYISKTIEYNKVYQMLLLNSQQLPWIP